jgi:Zinc carboxypeptidase
MHQGAKMTVRSFISIIWLLSVTAIAAFAQTAVQIKPGRDPKVAVDEEYTKKIREYTTETFFNSPLTDYLPASSKVPTPKAVLGDVAGAPGILPYSHEVYRYMRTLESSSPRVKVYSIGKTEEGREMIAVAVSSEANIAKVEANRAQLAKLADPRAINRTTTKRRRSSPPRSRFITSPARSIRPKPGRRRR